MHSEMTIDDAINVANVLGGFLADDAKEDVQELVVIAVPRDARFAWPEDIRQAAEQQSDGTPSARRRPLPNREKAMSPEQATFERHYRIGELAELWKLGREHEEWVASESVS